MLTVSDVSIAFPGQTLFKNVDLKFTDGNCYGIIGANGAGKSTFLRVLSGQLEPTTGHVSMPPNTRMSVLKQDHFAFDEYTVLDTVIMGNKELYDIGKEKDAIYAKADFSDEDGMRVADLETQFAEMGGWEAESDVSKLIQGLGLDESILYAQMSSLPDSDKVKVLLAQALFGNPQIVLLDEPTNELDIDAIRWLEDFLFDYPGTVLVVSHDRHFLNNVCTHIVDIDYGQIKMYVGNYEFWYESSQLIQRLIKAQNKRAEEKIAELQSFIARFSANKSKSRQATSRKKLLDKITIEEMPASSRRYPFVGFTPTREPGKDILAVNNISKAGEDGLPLLQDVSFRLDKGDKVAFLSENPLAVTELFKIIMEESQPDAGAFKWGNTVSVSYFPKDNGDFFEDVDLNLIEWMRQYTTTEDTETFLRGFLGRMLFSGDEVYKPAKVLSGGERVRCMLSRMMLFGSNALVLDQPTNHLDLESITAVNNGLRDFKGIVLFTSHDHEFIQTIANRIIEITPTGVIDRRCTYDEYLEMKAQKKF
ncbi:MAG: ATP-binding cassette domain-containing protein [Clostridia bacterium]|nr:ATP-binding cassette domain-containing protein [Clostridia bacterium]